MAKAKAARASKRQLGQYMTPGVLAQRVISDLALTPSTRVLEPSFGDGAFIMALVARFMELHDGDMPKRLDTVLRENLFGIEIDPQLRQKTLAKIQSTYGYLPLHHNLELGDFFVRDFGLKFDLIVGNPPFGGTFDPMIENRLDKLFGYWDGHKLKKETYSFFIARSLEMLGVLGSLHFISSDTFLTIKTMAGLRRRLMDQAAVRVETLTQFSDETQQPTLILHAERQVSDPTESVEIDGQVLTREIIELTGNFSWRIDESSAPYFAGESLSSYIVATSGMTIGKNELFIREIKNNTIVEPYDFEFFNDPVTLARELERARLNQLSPKKQAQISGLEAAGTTRRNVKLTERAVPKTVIIPNADYRFYNKASSAMVYSEPKWVVFWRDEGDAVYAFKKNGNWYLHGVGGKNYFGREGMTWQLIAARIKMRYLPPGYILDSGAPCAFLREGVSRNEFWFVMGWLWTPRATQLLKSVINHTRNIQGKDVERLPYPWWVSDSQKERAVTAVRSILASAMAGESFDDKSPEIIKLAELYEMSATHSNRVIDVRSRRSESQAPVSLRLF